jgi:alanine-glyoxylate transaminase/serine-glyoxylate transaminase/serine-pyruvate transaminase
MTKNELQARGRAFLHTPGPTNIPDRILRAMDRVATDFTNPEFQAMAGRCFSGLRQVFKTEHPVLVYPASGHGAWEASLANVMRPGERMLIAETGAFSQWWSEMAQALGIDVIYVPGDWRRAADPGAIADALERDRDHEIKAVGLVHNETSTGVLSDVAAIRRAIDSSGHPALFLVDTISSLLSMDFRMDEWNVDVAVGGSQKGLMLPPGMSFTAVSPKALSTAKANDRPRHYWDWANLLNEDGRHIYPCTPPIHLYYGLAEALDMIAEEGIDNVIARHRRLADGVRAAVRHWHGDAMGPEINALETAAQSDSITAVLMPDGQNAEEVRQICRDRFNVLLGGGLLRMSGKAVRIGHLGDLNEPMILGTLASVEMALGIAAVPHCPGGVQAAMTALAAPNQTG